MALTEILHTIPKNWQTLKPHPLAALVEFGAGMDLAGLAESMRVNGYDPDEAIIMLDGFVLDGRHRLQAAKFAGVVPTFKRFIGKDPVAFVTKKLLRQHLSTSQRAMLAAALANAKVGRPELNGRIQPVSTAEAAEKLHVGTSSVKDAKLVTEVGTQEQQEAVRSGTRSVSSMAEEIRTTRQPGDEEEPTPPPSTPRNKPDPTAAKNGEEQFSLRAFNGFIGNALKEIDKLARQHGITRNGHIDETLPHLAIRRKMEEAQKDLERWKTQLEKASGKKQESGAGSS